MSITRFGKIRIDFKGEDLSAGKGKDLSANKREEGENANKREIRIFIKKREEEED